MYIFYKLDKGISWPLVIKKKKKLDDVDQRVLPHPNHLLFIHQSTDIR